MNNKRLTPKQIMRLIDQGLEHTIPKSKTWHRFKEYMRTNGAKGRTCLRSDVSYANDIGIALESMKKFLSGRYVISSGNMKKIQDYLQREVNDRTEKA